MENYLFKPDQDIPLDTNKTPNVKGKANQIAAQRGPGVADKFCTYRLANGREAVKCDLVYKPRFVLTIGSINAGLQGIVYPEQDAISQKIEGIEAASKWIVSAVITQLFSYMIRDMVQYGYISTGEVMIFLNITDSHEIVQYHVSIPHEVVKIDDPATLHQTATAQVITFSLHVLAAKTPPQMWFDKGSKLGSWEVVDVDWWWKVPESIRKERGSPA